MTEITPELIRKVLDKADLVELVREDTELVESLGRLYGICPLCRDREILLMVNPVEVSTAAISNEGTVCLKIENR